MSLSGKHAWVYEIEADHDVIRLNLAQYDWDELVDLDNRVATEISKHQVAAMGKFDEATGHRVPGLKRSRWHAEVLRSMVVLQAVRRELKTMINTVHARASRSATRRLLGVDRSVQIVVDLAVRDGFDGFTEEEQAAVDQVRDLLYRRACIAEAAHLHREAAMEIAERDEPEAPKADAGAPKRRKRL